MYRRHRGNEEARARMAARIDRRVAPWLAAVCERARDVARAERTRMWRMSDRELSAGVALLEQGLSAGIADDDRELVNRALLKLRAELRARLGRRVDTPRKKKAKQDQPSAVNKPTSRRKKAAGGKDAPSEFCRRCGQRTRDLKRHSRYQCPKRPRFVQGGAPGLGRRS